MESAVGGVIYWLFVGIALLLIVNSVPNIRSGMDLGQVLASAIVYVKGRDMPL